MEKSTRIVRCGRALHVACLQVARSFPTRQRFFFDAGWDVGWADGEGRMDFCRLGALRMCMLQPFGGFFLEAVHLASFSRNLMNFAPSQPP